MDIVYLKGNMITLEMVTWMTSFNPRSYVCFLNGRIQYVNPDAVR